MKGELEEALSLAKTAVDLQNADTQTSHDLHTRYLGEELATLAWAVAANDGEVEEVDHLVDRAVASVGMDVVSSTAQVHTQAGAAYAVLGDTELSAFHLNKAAAVDLNGLWGRRAKAMLEAVGTFSMPS